LRRFNFQRLHQGVNPFSKERINLSSPHLDMKQIYQTMSETSKKSIDRVKTLWLEGVELPGEAAHPGKNFSELWAKRSRLVTRDEQVAFSLSEVNGSARLGMGLLTEDYWMRARVSNSILIRSLGNLPGCYYHLGFQPQYLYPSLQGCWIANSSYLTSALWRNFDNLKAHGGATVYFCLSNQYRSNIKHCTLMHATLLTSPDMASDGPSHFLEVNYNPYMVDGLDEKVIDRAFGTALRNGRHNREPHGELEQLMAGFKLDNNLAKPDLVWGGPIVSREPLSVYWPEASAKNGKQRPLKLEGVLAFKLGADQHCVLLKLFAFMNASYNAGYMVTNNAHDDANSSLRTTIRALIAAITCGTENHFGDKWRADALMAYIASLASDCLWYNDETQMDDGEYKAEQSILDIESFEADATKISAKKFMENVRAILSHPTLMKGSGSENSYNTTYMCHPSLPHDHPDAKKLYRADAELALELLEEKERLIRNL
jgi:hypothetical protein